MSEENSNRQILPTENSLGDSNTEDQHVAHNLNSIVSTSSGNSQQRQPRNMQGLLKFILEYTKSEDTTNNSQLNPLDEERREFLTKVFESMTVDFAKKLTDCLKTIFQVNNITEADDPSDCENALEEIMELVGNIDVANDFLKIGGLHACKPCLYSSHNGIRWRAAQLIGECAQNNPSFQDNAVQMTFLTELIQIVDTDRDELVKVKALFAISAIIRGNEKSTTFFHDIDVCHVLIRALQSNCDRLKIKVAFLLSTAFASDEFLKIQLQKIGFVTVLIQCLMEALDDKKLTSLEHYLGALIALTNGIPDALEDCRQTELNFLTVLNNIISNYNDDSSCMEAVSYATTMKHLVYFDSDVINADR